MKKSLLGECCCSCGDTFFSVSLQLMVTKCRVCVVIVVGHFHKKR